MGNDVSPRFKADINAINQMTVPKEIREAFGLTSGDRIELEFIGKVSKEIVTPAEKLQAAVKKQEER